MSDHDEFSEDVAKLERALLRSARLDGQPVPTSVRNQILLSAGAFGGVVGGSAAAAGSTAAIGGASSWAGAVVLVKWLAAGAVVGGLGIGAMHAMRPAPSPSLLPRTAPVAREPSRDEPRALLPLASPTTESRSPASLAPPAPLPERRPAVAVRQAPEDGPERKTPLAIEVASLDRARAALASGQPTRALAVLDTYQRAFPRGTLRPEAMYVRVQALMEVGDRAAAHDLAVRFIAQYPDSPHVAQLAPLAGP
jgi:hypothetical protein